MEKTRIKEILEAYRPGEGLESDPEVRHALELAAEDPDLSAFRQQSAEFDAVFSSRLKDIHAPESLYDRILANAPNVRESVSTPTGNRLIQWLHPAAFGVAATIIILLALSFTFFRNPAPDSTSRLTVQDELMPTAKSLYASLSPSFKSRDASQILNYLNSRGGTVPAALPKGFAFDKSFACDVIDLNGRTVSLICFKSEDSSNMLHLFTFLRSDFPMESLPTASHPLLNPGKKGASAVWANDDQIHVLFSDNGDEDLRKILDI